jgi:hypothetical protein
MGCGAFQSLAVKTSKDGKKMMLLHAKMIVDGRN